MADEASTRPRARRKPPTIYEVAQLAGVSHQTVSRFLRKDPTMGPETARRVAQAVAELGYRPNLAARTMRTRRSNRITVILPGSLEYLPTRLLTATAAVIHEAGYVMDVMSLEGDATTRAARLESLLQPETTDGVLAFTTLGDGPAGSVLSDSPVPIVIDGLYDDHMHSIGPFADASIAADVLRRLAEWGHRRFVHVAGHPEWTSARDRRAVYEATIAELGLESCAVVEGDWSTGSGWTAATEVIAGSGATAVFAASDDVAFGVVLGLQSVGLDVPRDVSVFGWDDRELGRYLRPRLTTISVDQERKGREVAQRLLALLRGEPAAEQVDTDTATLTRVVWRESTGPAPTRTA